MAYKPQSFKVVNKKNRKGEEERIIILYKNVIIEEETALINYYLDKGYQPMYEVKKAGLTVEDMRKELAGDKEASEKFEKAYATKITKDMTKEEKKLAGFFGACKVYNEWKKANKAKKDK